MIAKLRSLFSGLEGDLHLLQLLGPLSLLATLAIGANVTGAFPYDLLVIGAVGLFLCARWQMRGCAYALLFLAMAALFTHSYGAVSHATQFGLEGSLAFALLIAGQSFEEGSSLLHSLSQRIGAGQQTIENLEDEIGRHKELSSQELVGANSKIEVLSRDLEELRSEYSALQVLNEVLRKSSAKSAEEKETLFDETVHLSHKIAELSANLDAASTELLRVKNDSILAQQNQELFSEINEVRCKEEQTRLINETLARLHAKESQRAVEFEGKIAAMSADREGLVEEMSFVKRDAEMNASQVEQLSHQLQVLTKENQGLQQVQQERNFLRERLGIAEMDVQQKAARLVALEAENAQLIDRVNSPGVLSDEQVVVLSNERTHLLEQIEQLRGHLAQHANTDAMYQQLREQFEEKNKVLHETRAQLFHTDTEFQTVKRELENKTLDVDPLAVVVREELAKLEEINRDLDLENRQLQEVVSQLMAKEKDLSASAISPRVKKK